MLVQQCVRVGANVCVWRVSVCLNVCVVFVQGHRVLIFSLFTSMLDYLEDFCMLKGHKYLRLDGSTVIVHSCRVCTVCLCLFGLSAHACCSRCCSHSHCLVLSSRVCACSSQPTAGGQTQVPYQEIQRGGQSVLHFPHLHASWRPRHQSVHR